MVAEKIGSDLDLKKKGIAHKAILADQESKDEVRKNSKALMIMKYLFYPDNLKELFKVKLKCMGNDFLNPRISTKCSTVLKANSSTSQTTTK